MRPEASAVSASPLTVWVGSTRYVFAPGRDVLVGSGRGVDIPLDRHGGAPPPPAHRLDVVLRFTGSRWIAIDRSPHGVFVNGARVGTVDIHSGQAITIGDPRRGPRLVFQIGPAQRPAYPPPPRPAAVAAQPDRPARPEFDAPTQRDTQRMRTIQLPPPAQRPSAPPAPPAVSPAPPVRPAVPPPPPRHRPRSQMVAV